MAHSACSQSINDGMLASISSAGIGVELVAAAIFPLSMSLKSLSRYVEEKANALDTENDTDTTDADHEATQVSHQETATPEKDVSCETQRSKSKSSNQAVTANDTPIARNRVNSDSSILQTGPIDHYMRPTTTSRRKTIGMSIEEDPVTNWKTVHQELKQVVDERSSVTSEMEYMAADDADTNHRTTLMISADTKKGASSQNSTVDLNVTLSLD